MRVLMATMQLDIGGAETHIVELSKALARRGLEVYVASNGGAYEKELAEAGITHIKVPFHSKNPMCMYKAYTSLRKIILDYDFDIVHAHARIPAFLCGLLQKRYHFRFVTTAHWVFSTRFPYNLLTCWGDRSLAVSDDIKTYLMDNYGIPGDNIRVTINGIDTEKFSKDTDYSGIAAEFDLKEDKRRIVYVSRMDTDRSLAAHKLIAIARELANEIPNLEIVIVGGGNDFEKIKEEAEAVNRIVGSRLIVTTGSRTDINQFTASGEMFIGVSRAALEAMACEKPSIIAGNEGYIGIFDEDKLQISIDTNFCCRGCRETSEEILKADVLSVLKAAPQERERLGQVARETVKQYYSVETMADDAMKMYVSEIMNIRINAVEPSDFAGIDNYLEEMRKKQQQEEAAVKCLPKAKRNGVDVVISGYYGFRNAGDDSILKTMIGDLKKEKPDISITVLSKDTDATERLCGVPAVNRFNLLKIYFLLKKTKLLISGGGSLIQDVTSDKSLAYYLGIISLAKHCGAKVMLYANGIGPVQNEKNYQKVRSVLNKVDLITLRDVDSAEQLNQLGVTEPEIRVTADPAFGMEPESVERVDEILEKAGISANTHFVTIAVRPWEKLDPDFEKSLGYIADSLKRNYQLQTVFIPMQYKRDAGICRAVMETMESSAVLLEEWVTPQEILGIIKRSELLIGMRLHTLIYAAKVGTPVVGLTYDPKVQALMRYMGQKYSVPVESLNPVTILRYIEEILLQHDRISQELHQLGNAAMEKARQNPKQAIELIAGGEKE